MPPFQCQLARSSQNYTFKSKLHIKIKIMKKSDKKIEKAIREALTRVCEAALDTIDGFHWITHFVNYNNFPDSLVIVCVFDTDSSLMAAQQSEQGDYLRQLIQYELSSEDINIKKISSAVSFCTEDSISKKFH